MKDNVLNMGQQRTTTSMKVNQILDCIHRVITNKDRYAIVPLCSVLVRTHLECCVKFWSSQLVPHKKMWTDWRGF